MIEPIRIEPDALYDDGALRQCIGVTPSALAAARRDGTLRFTRVGKRIFYRGEWIAEWLDAAARKVEGGGA